MYVLDTVRHTSAMTSSEEPNDWPAVRDQHPTPPPAPRPVTPYTPYDITRPQHVPPQPPTQISYVQPVARQGLTGPHAAMYITLILVGVLIVLPVLCCLTLGLVGAIGNTGTTP